MGRLLSLLLLFLSLTFATSGAASAQDLTPADSAAILLDAARAFEADGRWEVAEALFQYITERYGFTPAGREAREVLSVAPPEGAGRASQVELMVWGTTYGLWLGVAIPGAFGADGSGPYGVGLLVGGPGGFLGSRALARSRSLSEGQVRAITFGSLWGTWQGWGIMEVLDLLEGEEDCYLDVCSTEDPDGSKVLRSMVVGGLAGIAGGSLLARKPISSGMATTVNFGALWGTWFGFAGGVLTGMEGDALLTSTLLTGNAGLISTAYLNRGWDLSRPRARLISIGGVIGLLGGLGLDLIFTPDSERVAVAIPLAGSIAGLTVAAMSTREAPGPGGRTGTGWSEERLAAFGASASEVRAGAGSEGGFPGALLGFSRGHLTLDAPRPFPVIVPVDGPDGFHLEPALGLNLFSMRF